jgi:hypothetical protein
MLLGVLLVAGDGPIAAFNTSQSMGEGAPAMKLPPTDECARDVSFREFRAQLIRAAERKDVQYLLAVTADDIKFSFGDNQGKAAFAKNWRLEAPASSHFWSELLSVLRLGCAFTGDNASAPYLFARFPNQFDPYDHVVAVHPRTRARVAPRAASRIIATFNGDILKLVGDDLAVDWIAVALPDGRIGHVRRSQVRSPVDYRAIFEKRGSHWQMTTFVAGD